MKWDSPILQQRHLSMEFKQHLQNTKRSEMNLRSQHFIDYQTSLYSFHSYRVKIATLIYNIYNRINPHIANCTSRNALDGNENQLTSFFLSLGVL